MKYNLTITGFKVVAYGDSYDWKDYGVDSILKRTGDNKKLGNGSILLLHDGAKYTVEASGEDYYRPSGEGL